MKNENINVNQYRLIKIKKYLEFISDDDGFIIEDYI